jgi:hypothetical protein
VREGVPCVVLVEVVVGIKLDDADGPAVVARHRLDDGVADVVVAAQDDGRQPLCRAAPSHVCAKQVCLVL